MARFEVFRAARQDLLLVDLQADLLDVLKTRIVAPLIPVDEMSWSISHLNPRFELDDGVYVMATQRMAAIPLAELGDRIADLSEFRDVIVAATDFLFQGF